MDKPDMEDTIVAISTPIGEGGIGIVRLSGGCAIKISDEIFVSKDNKAVSTFETYTVHYGHIVDKGSPNPEIIDEVILTVMKAPKSYTKEDIVEINCHGGLQAIKKVLELAMRRGASLAEPGEFTKRAFLNGRIDLAQAEAVLDIIRAKTEGSLKMAVHQLEGELSKSVNAMLDALIDITSQIEASIDFPDEGLETADKAGLREKTDDILKRLKNLLDSYGKGAILREGVLAMICGKPNVGKSSLMNLLLKRDRVIVSPIPGTTRDTVEETINLRGVPIRLVDTAGIAETKDTLVKEGVIRSRRYLELSDIVLLVMDNSTPIEHEDMDIAKLVSGKKKIIVINKNDLSRRLERSAIEGMFKGESIIEISVEKKDNIERLEEAILEIIYNGKFDQAEASIVSNARHKELLDKAFENVVSVSKALESDTAPELVSIDLREAVRNLGLIVGRSVSEDVLDRIFEQFCIGK